LIRRAWPREIRRVPNTEQRGQKRRNNSYYESVNKVMRIIPHIGHDIYHVHRGVSDGVEYRAIGGFAENGTA
jgi:hypothetical protein